MHAVLVVGAHDRRGASGRSVRERSPPSSNVYISFETMSVDAPTPRANRSVCSKIGVSMRRKPEASNTRVATLSTTARAAAWPGRMS